MSNGGNTMARLVIKTVAAAIAYLVAAGRPRLVATADGVFVERSAACPRCGGSGYFGPHNVAGGVCFACNGAFTRNDVELVDVLDYAQRARRRELAAARRSGGSVVTFADCDAVDPEIIDNLLDDVARQAEARRQARAYKPAPIAPCEDVEIDFLAMLAEIE
jgi:hypothetical protein